MRLLPRIEGDGPTQMALDEALLEAADQSTLRVYAWTPPAVSLGYFQDHAAIVAHLPPAMPVVRRITGGGAIWHQHEVTYSVVGELGCDGWPTTPRELYRVLHGAVLARLDQARLALQTATTGDRRYRDEPRCFASPAADDLIARQGGKVLGSAARTHGQRVLIHGSLKLASNPWDGETVAGCGLEWEAAAAVLTAGIAAGLQATLTPGSVTAAEQAACERIRRERYGDGAWVVDRRGPRP